jgi:hypothetical protein
MKKTDDQIESEGLGDSVAYLLSLLKIDKAVKAATEAMGIEDCGCSRRQKKLNELFPYKKEEKKKD